MKTLLMIALFLPLFALSLRQPERRAVRRRIR
jgi:hypothetical protein